MSAAAKFIDKKAFQALVPFNALSPMHFNEVAQKTVVESISAGRQIFKEGDRDNQSVYLLEGEISLLSGNDIVGSVTAGSDASRHPLAQQQPRQVSARAKTNVVVARVDSSLLDIMLTWDQSSGYEVSEISDEDDDDWMTRILQSQAFLKLPASNIQRLLMRVESVPVQTGEVIIQQGGEGDYFYIIKNGRCMVTRRPSANAKEVKLAELGDGDAFGEDALVSDAKRNATVTMISDGVLMRLAKKDFIELLKEPLLNKLDYNRAMALVEAGAEWLDVRLPGEYENVHIQGSCNIPLSALRLDANGLNESTKYIVCCETGRRSASAAFVLSQRGFEVYVLEDGFSSVPPEMMIGATVGVTPALSVVANEPLAAVVALKPGPAPTPASNDTDDNVSALQGDLESLQQEKLNLELAQVQLAARVTELQEELERVRDVSREEIMELELNLAETRQESASARTELQTIKEKFGSQRQADADLRLQTELLENELAERREREKVLLEELTALRQHVSELDAACAVDAKWRSSALAEQAQVQIQLDALQAQAEQAADYLERIQQLENALAAAEQSGTQSETQQSQRISELENALQEATAALLQQQELVEQQHLAGQAEYAKALATADGITQQLQVLQQQVLDLEAARAEAATRLLEQEQQFAEERTRVSAQLQARIDGLEQAAVQAVTAADEACLQREQAQTCINELTLALKTAQDEQAQSLDAVRAESEHLHEALNLAEVAQAALAKERDELWTAQATVLEAQQSLQAELEQVRARAHDLEADAGTQVTQLQTQLVALQAQIQNQENEREALLHQQAQLQQVHDELTLALKTAQYEQAQSLDAARAESERLYEALNHAEVAQVALAKERDELWSAQATALAAQQSLQAELEQVRARAHDLEADAGTQVTQLQTQLAALQAQIQNQENEREALLHQQAQLQQEQIELSQKLGQAQAQVQALSADSGEQIQTLQGALAAAQHELQLLQEQQEAHVNDQRLQAQELSAAQALLNETQSALTAVQATLSSLQFEYEQTQQQAAQLQQELQNAEHSGTQTVAELRAMIEALQVELDVSHAAQVEIRSGSEQQLLNVEQQLNEARGEAEQQVHEARQAMVAAQEQYMVVQAELVASSADLARLQQQQADAASSQDEQAQTLTQLREQLEHSETRLRESEVAQSESKMQLAVQAQALDSAQQELAELQQLQQHAVAQAQAVIRNELEEQLKDVRSELDSARTALARGMQERGNLEQGLQAEFVATKTELSVALQRAEAELDERQEQLAAAQGKLKSLNELHAELLASTEQQQQAWQAEFDQLRAAATADIEATHIQMQRLKEDLAAARKLNAGASQSDELQRLQILLDQAREEADQARVEAERAREQSEFAANVSAASNTDEIVNLKAQQDELRLRELAANQQRELVEQELIALREKLLARDEQITFEREQDAISPQRLDAEQAGAPRGNRLWLGLVAGLVLGVLGMAGVSWFGEPAPSATLAQSVVTSDAASINVSAVKKTEQHDSKLVTPSVMTPLVKQGREFRDGLNTGGKGPAMIEVTGARFSMGSPAISPDFNERPQHDVELSSYAIGKFEVTFAEYDEFARATKRTLPNDEGRGRGSRPVVNVTWNDAVAYAQWLSAQTGKSYRLPSEAEWEYAAGNVNRGVFWWGSAPEQGRANCYDCGSQWDAKSTAPVGSFVANQLGLYDTAGNVSEWVEDCYHDSYNSAPTNGDAWVDSDCSTRVIRGGGYNSPINMLRLAKRIKQTHSMSADDLGFRVARDL